MHRNEIPAQNEINKQIEKKRESEEREEVYLYYFCRSLLLLMDTKAQGDIPPL